MGNLIYLTLEGKNQGLISSSCGTKESIGNKYQLGRENQIFIYSVQHLFTKDLNAQHHPVVFTKPVDRSSLLLAQSIMENETLKAKFDFYRTAEQGGIERYYSISLTGASIISLKIDYPHSLTGDRLFPQEVIALNYQTIDIEHLLSATSTTGYWLQNI